MELKQENAFQIIIELLIAQQIKIDFIENVLLEEQSEKHGTTFQEILDIHASYLSEKKTEYLSMLYERFGYIGNIDDIINGKK